MSAPGKLKRSYMHPDEFRDEYARDLLQKNGMESEHPDYQLFFRLIMRICENTRSENSRRHSVGAQLHELTVGETVTPDQLAAIRAVAVELSRWSALPDHNALQAVGEAITARVAEKVLADARRRSNKNLKTPSASVTDEQIRAALSLPTRTEQARRLGITERQLLRRLKKMG